MTNLEVAILQHLESMLKPRSLTRAQRLRNWARSVFGLAPLPGDEPYELPGFMKHKPFPENATGTVLFRRALPQPMTGGDA